jgi:hypothetical protein
MAGDATKAALWQNADVYIAPIGTAAPTDVATAWGAGWEAVGLLDGAEGFTESRDQETSEHFAWGGVLVKKTKSKHKRTLKFVALEDNDVVFDLVNPGSTRTTDATTGLITSKVVIPQGAEFAIGFETRDGSKVRRRIVKRAEVDEVGEVKAGEEDPEVYEVTVLIYPESDNTLYTDLQDTV